MRCRRVEEVVVGLSKAVGVRLELVVVRPAIYGSHRVHQWQASTGPAPALHERFEFDFSQALKNEVAMF